MEIFAWIKTVDDKRNAPELPPCDGSIPEPCKASWLSSGDRPPRAAATILADLTLAQQNEVSQCCDAHHIRLSVSRRTHGELRVDSTYSGLDGESFELLRFIGSRASAIRWISSSEGEHWRNNATNVALIKLTTPSEDAVAALIDVAQYGSLHQWSTSKFDLDSWRSDFLRLASHEDDSDLWLTKQQVEGLVKCVLPGLLTLAKQGDSADLTDGQDATAAHSEEARAQASDVSALTAVLAPHRVSLKTAATLQLFDRIRRETRHTTFRLKWLFARARPWEIHPGRPLAVKSGEPLFPAHAAFPAGHAVLAHAAVFLLSKARSNSTVDYATNAEKIGRNRVKAGLHWQTDIEAGKLVGTKFGELLWKDQRIRDLVEQVCNELA